MNASETSQLSPSDYLHRIIEAKYSKDNKMLDEYILNRTLGARFLILTEMRKTALHTQENHALSLTSINKLFTVIKNY